MSFRDFNLFYYFAMKPNTLHSRDFLVEYVWNNGLNGDIYLNKALSVLRNPIRNDPRLSITTYRGSGIVFSIGD